jgi:hypothetical protein
MAVIPCSKSGCKGIGTAQVGIDNIVGCKPCPTFPSNARMSRGPGVIRKYREKFRRHGFLA